MAQQRGFMAREYVKALRIKRKAEIERRRKEEEQRRKKELQEKGEQLMEESFISAQKELYAMSRVAQQSADQMKMRSAGDNVNLDSMFTFLADDRVTAKPEGALADDVGAELDRLFVEKLNLDY